MCVIISLHPRGRYLHGPPSPTGVPTYSVSHGRTAVPGTDYPLTLTPKGWSRLFGETWNRFLALKFRPFWSRFGEGCSSYSFKAITAFSFETVHLESVKLCHCNWMDMMGRTGIQSDGA